MNPRGKSNISYIVQRLTTKHDRQTFDCGVPALNTYLQKQARQDMERGVTTVYVLVPSIEHFNVAGFYTLAATGIRLVDLPETTAKKLPRYPLVPATLVGRLAISRGHQGQKLGEFLLYDALSRSVEASQSIGSAAIVVDAKDSNGAGFYAQYGFKPLPDHPLRLFIAMKTVETLHMQ